MIEMLSDAKELERKAREEWGDVPTTRTMRKWDDGDYEVHIYHTIGFDASDGSFHRVEMKKKRGDPGIIHYIYNGTGKRGDIVWKEKCLP